MEIQAAAGSMIHNPILKGFHPDPSIIRVGSDYYIATSTFEWWPGVRLHHSKDLVNWELVGYLLNRVSQLDLRGVGASQGVWAPCLTYDGGTFYLLYTVVTAFYCNMYDTNNYLVTARDISGPWSEPVPLNNFGFDPSLFHDEDGRKYIVSMATDHRVPKKYAGRLVLQEYDPAAREMIGPVRDIYKADRIFLEGPYIFRRKGWYYLFAADTGTGEGHGQSILRSRNVWGPYEMFRVDFMRRDSEDEAYSILTSRHHEDLPLSVKAIRDKYPEIKIVGTSGPFAAGPEYDRGWRCARQEGIALVDEHYYQAPEWFIAHHHRYDDFPAEGPKVFVGEYASKDNTWFNALAEASYMVGLERNAHAVGLACYAPMLCNEDYCNWRPNMIWFDNHQIMRTPNYYVQKLFMEHQGTALLSQKISGAAKPAELCGFPDSLAGNVALSGYEFVAEFWDIVLTNTDTGERRSIQGPVRCEGTEPVCLCDLDWRNYTIQVKAREIDGWKGFCVYFGVRDQENKLCWQLGGWNNADSLIGEWVNGRDSVLTQRDFRVEKDRVYQLELRVRGRRIAALLDGRPSLETEALHVLAEPLYAISSLDEGSGDIIIKLVNVLPVPQTANITLKGMDAAEGTAHFMGGYPLKARNTLGQPESVIPWEETVSFHGGSFTWAVPPESLCVLRLRERAKSIGKTCNKS